MAIKQTKRIAKQANVEGPQVRKFRMESGMSQKELAARCEERGLNLPRGTLAKIESQVRFVTARELFIIGKALTVPMEQFYPAGFGGRRVRHQG